MGDVRIEVTLDEENQIIRQRLEGLFDEAAARRLVDTVIELKKRLRDPDKVCVLALSDLTAKATPGARRMLMENINRNDLYKMAMVGKNPYMKAVLTFFLMVSGTKKIGIFTSENEALEWLKA